jgi:hypothetical protein
MDKDHPDRDRTLFFNFAKDDFDSEVFNIETVEFRKAGPKGTKLECWPMKVNI